MIAGQLARYGETQPCAARANRALERLEQFFARTRGQTRTIVPDYNFENFAFACG